MTVWNDFNDAKQEWTFDIIRFRLGELQERRDRHAAVIVIAIEVVGGE